MVGPQAARNLPILPWPDVPECHGHPFPATCAQCDGSHAHRWLMGLTRTALAKPQDADLFVATRCTYCGARKCDVRACTSRRHHIDPHVGPGFVRAVGA